MIKKQAMAAVHVVRLSMLLNDLFLFACEKNILHGLTVEMTSAIDGCATIWATLFVIQFMRITIFKPFFI